MSDCPTTSRVHQEGGNGCLIMPVRQGRLGIPSCTGDHHLQAIWISSGTDQAPVQNKEAAQARHHQIKKNPE